jgi:hypothetical protein
MKKLFYGVFLVVALAMMAFNVYTAAQDVQAARGWPATFHALMTLLWLVSALDAVGALVPRFKTWMKARWRALQFVLDEYRLYREICYASAFVIPVLALPLLAFAVVVVALLTPFHYAYCYVRDEWISTRNARREMERSYRISREAFARAKAATSDVLPKAATSA